MNPFEEICYYFSQPNPSHLPLNSITSQQEDSNSPRLLDNFSAVDPNNDQYYPSLPIQYSHHHQPHHEGFSSINHQNQSPSPPLQLDSPLALRNSLLETPYLNVQYKDSQILPSVPIECDNMGLNDPNNTFQGNQISYNGFDETNECNEDEESSCEAVQSKGRYKKTKSTFGERSSMYRGVSRYTGRYEAFLWDNTDPTEKSKTVYVGGFEREVDAARAYDLAALKFWGRSAPLNFPLSDYTKQWEEMQHVTKKEYLLAIRRSSKGFAKGVSNYRGVTRNSDNRRWQARIGKGKGIKGIYLGTFDSEEEAARAYDVAVIRMKGMKAVTNFDLNHYDVQSILESSKLPIGKGASKLLKKASVDDLLQKKKNNGTKHPILQLQIIDSSDDQNQPKLQYALQQIPSSSNNNYNNNMLLTRSCFNSYNAKPNQSSHNQSQFYGNQLQYQNPAYNSSVFSGYQNPCFQEKHPASFLNLPNGVGGYTGSSMSNMINGGSAMSQAYPSFLNDGVAFNVENGMQSCENLPKSFVVHGDSGMMMMENNVNSNAENNKQVALNVGQQLGTDGSSNFDSEILPSWLEIFLKNAGSSASNA